MELLEQLGDDPCNREDAKAMKEKVLKKRQAKENQTKQKQASAKATAKKVAPKKKVGRFAANASAKKARTVGHVAGPGILIPPERDADTGCGGPGQPPQAEDETEFVANARAKKARTVVHVDGAGRRHFADGAVIPPERDADTGCGGPGQPPQAEDETELLWQELWRTGTGGSSGSGDVFAGFAWGFRFRVYANPNLNT